MDELYIYRCGYEKCLSDKEMENLICPINMLHFVISGSGYFNDKLITSGKVFLCRNQCHNIWYPNKNDPWNYFFINPDGKLADKLVSEYFGELDVLDYTFDENVRSLMDMAVNVREPDVRSGIFIALLGFVKPFKQNVSISNVMPENHLSRAEYLINLFGGNTTPSEIASELGLSRAYLYNIFKKYRGYSICEAIIRYRMKYAARLLRETDYSIFLIAESVGYADQFSFSKMFKSKYGISPSEYRTAKFDPE